MKASDIKKNFSFDSRRIEILRGVGIAARPGEIIGIVGASGTGKTTLLQILGGLDSPNSGTVTIDGVDIFSLGDDDRSRLRGGKIGFVFQFHHLLPEFSALENVLIPSKIAGTNEADAEKRAKELFASVGMSDRMDHRPGKLSGGEQQRTAIIRALINEPALLLADEPTGNLDEGTAGEVFEVIKRFVRERSLAAIVVTHNLKLAEGVDTVYELHDGLLAPIGGR